MKHAIFAFVSKMYYPVMIAIIIGSLVFGYADLYLKSAWAQMIVLTIVLIPFFVLILVTHLLTRRDSKKKASN